MTHFTISLTTVTTKFTLTIDAISELKPQSKDGIAVENVSVNVTYKGYTYFRGKSLSGAKCDKMLTVEHCSSIEDAVQKLAELIEQYQQDYPCELLQGWQTSNIEVEAELR